MRIGDLRHRIVVQQIIATPDGHAWSDVATLWACVTGGAGGREFQTARQSRATLTDQIEIRYRPGITQDMRILHGDRVLSIAQPPIDPDGRRKRHLIFCEEIAVRLRVTFTRTTSAYDSATDTDSSPVTTSITGFASAAAADVDAYRRLGLTHTTAVSLFFSPDTVGQVPAAGDTVVWSGVAMTVAESKTFAPEGVPVSATLVCRRG
jgi:SPP1 family predicted phage head-tail adaptor